MTNLSRLRRQKDRAAAVLPPSWVAAIVIAVDETAFLSVRVPGGYREQVLVRLRAAGIRGPFEVVEPPGTGRYANPARTEPIHPYRYPVLPQPLPEKMLVTELAGLLEQAGLTRDGSDIRAQIWLWDPLDAEHARKPRRYAQVIPELRRFEFARATLRLPYCHRRGLMAHEIGHVLVPEGSEADADTAAARVLGIQIGYDKRWPGKGLQFARNCRAR